MRPEFTLHDLLFNAAERDPEQTAVVDGTVTRSYAELLRDSQSLAAGLLDAGLRKGDRVGIYLDKTLDAVVGMLGVSLAGGIYVNLNGLLKPRQANHIVRDCAVRMLIADPARIATIEPGSIEVVFSTGPDPVAGGPTGSVLDLASVYAAGERPLRAPSVIEQDVATILYTSGSTGLPKGVVFSQRNVVAGAQIVSTYLENAREDRILSVLPFSFDYGMSQMTTAVRVGATLVLQHSSLPGDLLRSLRDEQITGLAGVPPLWPLLLHATRHLGDGGLPHLRYITNSGGRIPPANLAQLRQRLPTTQIFLMYGLTEAFRSTYLPPAEIERGSECIGKPIPNTEILVVAPDGHACGPNEPGELVHRGPTVAFGYWGNAEATAKSYRPHPFAPEGLPGDEKVVYSGDLVRRDEEGYLYFVSRRDQMIKTGGYRVSPEEVEDLLVSTGMVRHACAFGRPDPEIGEHIVAIVSLWDGVEVTADELRAAYVESAPPYMVPRVLRIEEDLPKTPSGKIDRRAVRDAYADR